jgi:hypothetical protein
MRNYMQTEDILKEPVHAGAVDAGLSSDSLPEFAPSEITTSEPTPTEDYTPEQKELTDSIIALFAKDKKKQAALKKAQRTTNVTLAALKGECDQAHEVRKKLVLNRREVQEGLKSKRAEAVAVREDLAKSLCAAHKLLGGDGREGKFGPFLSQLNCPRTTAYRLMKKHLAQEEKNCAEAAGGTLPEFTEKNMDKLVAAVALKCRVLSTTALIDKFLSRMGHTLKEQAGVLSDDPLCSAKLTPALTPTTSARAIPEITFGDL